LNRITSLPVYASQTQWPAGEPVSRSTDSLAYRLQAASATFLVSFPSLFEGIRKRVDDRLNRSKSELQTPSKHFKKKAFRDDVENSVDNL
jgi:hypothetical protein